MKLKLSKALSFSLYALVMILAAGMVIGSLYAKEAKKGTKGPGGPDMAEGLSQRLELDEKTAEKFTKIYNKVYDEKFNKKMKTFFDKMKSTERGSDDGKKVMDEMETVKKEYDTKFLKEVEKAKTLTKDQSKKLKEMLNEKKGPGPGGPKPGEECKEPKQE
ncbi:MAG: hypothetical protein PHF84_04515 [bacterium]|nr:hypothetical protein [bacterium]